MTRQQAGVSAEAVGKLVAEWREAIVKLKAGVEDSPSYDLKRLIKERSEAFTICADELEQALATPPPVAKLSREQVEKAIVPLLEPDALLTVIPWHKITGALNALLTTAPPEQAARKDETMNLMQKPTPQEEKNFEEWLEATNSTGLRAAIIKLRDAANAEVKVCPEVALRCFQEGRVQMAQNILELLPDQPQAASGEVQSRSIQRRIALQKGEPVPTFGATSAGARNQNYLDDLRHDLQDEEFRFQYLAACATDSEGALRNGIKDVLEAALAAHDQKVREEATLAEHQSHVEFENELYATLVDPVAEGSIKEAEMRKQLLEQARWYRQRVHDLEDFTALLKGAQQGLETWAAKPGNQKWWKRIDGTPIPNDLLVNIAQAIRAPAASKPEAGSKGEK